MATTKKTPSQGNLVDMLAAFGRGALNTLTERFDGYDAALESMATHEGQIASINQGKTSWANGGTITSETYYNILKGTQDSFTLPFDLNGFVSGITANGNAQRYSGVMYAVSYANKPGNPKQRSDTLYLPFAAVNAENGVVAFEDLQFRYADLQNDEVDVRYKVTPVSNSQIKLEKVEVSAAAELPWLDVTPQGEEELDKFIAAFIQEAGVNGKADYELNLNASTDLTQYRGIRLDLTEGNVVETPVVATVGNGFICAPAFLSDNEFVFGITKETGGKFILHIYNLSSQYVNALSDYAKKTDIPEQPFTFVVDGDAAGYDVDGLVSGVTADFDIPLPTAIKTLLTQALYKITIAENAAAGTVMSVPDTDIVNLMPRFTLLLEKGNFGYRFYAAGTQNESGLIHFKGTISLNAKSTEWVAVCDLGSASRITFNRIM